ncbi:MAG: glycosyltransferase [Haloarculaceae archaeon]
MRVAVVALETVHRRETEGTRRVQRVAEDLAADGHEVTVFCTRWWPESPLVVESGAVTYNAVTDEPSAPVFAFRLPFLLAQEPFDAVHVHPVPPAVLHAACVGAAFVRAPLVADWYGDEAYPDTLRGRTALRGGSLMTAPSELVCSWVREAGATVETTVVPEPIDFDLVSETEPAGDAEVMIATDLDEDANLTSALLALADLSDVPTTTVVGDGPERDRYESQAHDLKLQDSVTFVGDRPREERVARYRAADVFVHTATWAPFATELLWGLACGCVGVVQYQAESAAHELVAGYGRGLLATDDEDVVDALREARTFPHWSIDESFADYDRGAVLDRYLSLYRDLD